MVLGTMETLSCAPPDKWALVTGSSGGLGFLLAQALLRAGYGVVLTGRHQERLDTAVGILEDEQHGHCIGVCLDLTENGAAKILHSAVKEHFVALSLVVNNLGGSVQGDRRNIPTEVLNAAMRRNLTAGIDINNIFYDDLAENSGVIAHIGSTAALHFDAPPGYVISKFALHGYIKNAARMFAKEGVCIFGVLPGILDYEGSYINMMQSTHPERYQEFLDKTTYGRFPTGEELARFLAGLVQCGVPMINGALLQFDGGES